MTTTATTTQKNRLWRVPRPSSSPSPIEGCKQPINQSGLQVAPNGDVEQSQSEQKNPNNAEGGGEFSRNEWIEETEQVSPYRDRRMSWARGGLTLRRDRVQRSLCRARTPSDDGGLLSLTLDALVLSERVVAL
jgi:hypothetical protein